ncbi:MAG: NifU family protein [Phycisphaerae bacterium]|nr:NifU family protein [Phycisphaerae bacterium]
MNAQSNARSGESKSSRNLRVRIQAVLDRLRPMIHNDGGDVEFVDVDDKGVVSVRLRGACVGCPSSSLTLALGIERNLRDEIPEVSRVICVEEGPA